MDLPAGSSSASICGEDAADISAFREKVTKNISIFREKQLVTLIIRSVQ